MSLYHFSSNLLKIYSHPPRSVLNEALFVLLSFTFFFLYKNKAPFTSIDLKDSNLFWSLCKVQLKVPVVVRLEGTNVDQGKRILKVYNWSWIWRARTIPLLLWWNNSTLSLLLWNNIFEYKCAGEWDGINHSRRSGWCGWEGREGIMLGVLLIVAFLFLINLLFAVYLVQCETENCFKDLNRICDWDKLLNKGVKWAGALFLYLIYIPSILSLITLS